MQFEITRISVTADGLQGGRQEFDPYLGIWASFTLYRECKRFPLLRVGQTALYNTKGAIGPFVLGPDLTKLRGDESIWVQLMANSMESGVEELDTERGEDVVLNMQAGLVQLPLAKLLSTCDPVTGVGKLEHENLQDPNLLITTLMADRAAGKITNMRKLQQHATEKAHKAYITIEVRILNPGAGQIQAVLRGLKPSAPAGSGTAKNKCTGALLYTPDNFEHFARTLDKFITVYAENFIGAVDPKTGQLSGPPKYDTSNKNLKNLHFAIYRSPVGMLPVVAFWLHMASQRHYASEAERVEALMHYGLTAQTESFFESMMDASARRFGMTRASFMAAIREQHGQPASNATMSKEYGLALDVIADFGTFVANAAYYMSDQRYVNKASRPDQGENIAKAIGLESFDIVVMMLLAKIADCEDMGNIASSVIRCLVAGRADAKEGRKWGGDFIDLAASACERRVLFDLGGGVTAAYLGANGKKLEKKDIVDLPLIGSTEDKRNSSGGHSWPIWVDKAVVSVWLANGGITDSPLGKNFPKWAYATRVKVLEGTGPIEHEFIPVGELHGEDSLEFKKAEAARKFVRESLSGDEHESFTQAFRPYSVPFYTKKQDPQRRISGFYLQAVHAGTADMYAIHRGLSQVTFVNRATGERGVEIGDICRDCLDGDITQSKISLIAPFYHMEKEWTREMVPVMEAMCNQMPVTSIGSIPRLQGERPLHFGAFSQTTLDEKLGANALSVHSPLIGNMGAMKLGGATGEGGGYGSTSDTGLSAKFATAKFSRKLADIAAAKDDIGLDAHIGAQLESSTHVGHAWKKNIDRFLSVNSTTTEVSWGRVQQALGWHLAHHGAEAGTSAKDIPVSVQAVDYTMDAVFRASELLEASGANGGWACLDMHRKGGECKRGRSRRVRHTRATLLPPVTTGDMASARITIAFDPDEPMAKSTISLLHVGIMGRIFALSPLVLEACDAEGQHARLCTTPANSFLQVGASRAPNELEVVLRFPSEVHFAVAFCTKEHVVAEPFITREMNQGLPPSAEIHSAIMQENALLSYDFGNPLDIATLSPFVDCYKRTDVVLVRFFGHEWSLRKHRAGFDKVLKKYYADGTIVAHEYAIGSPLPQSDDVIELHVLIRV